MGIMLVNIAIESGVDYPKDRSKDRFARCMMFMSQRQRNKREKKSMYDQRIHNKQ